jgi:hypothetical protein
MALEAGAELARWVLRPHGEWLASGPLAEWLHSLLANLGELRWQETPQLLRMDRMGDLCPSGSTTASSCGMRVRTWGSRATCPGFRQSLK